MSEALARLERAWDGFWLVPGTALDLAAARVIVAGQALWVLLSRDPAALSALPAEFWHGTALTTRWRYLAFEGHASIELTLQRIAILALVCAILGLLPRISCFVAGLLLYHLAPYEKLFYGPHPVVKGFTLSLLMLLVLSFARCGDRLAWRARERATAVDYGWPLRLVQVLLAQVYVFVGWSRLLKSGVAAFSGASLHGYLLAFNANDQIGAFRTLGLWLASQPALCTAAASLALVFDFAFVLVLFRPQTRKVLIPVALVGHVLILFTLNVAFLEAPLLLLFVNWNRVAARLRVWRGQAEPSG